MTVLITSLTHYHSDVVIWLNSQVLIDLLNHSLLPPLHLPKIPPKQKIMLQRLHVQLQRVRTFFYIIEGMPQANG